MTVGLPNGAFVTSSRGFQKSKNSSDFSGGKEKVGPKFFEKPKRHKRTSRGKKYTHTSKNIFSSFFFRLGCCLWQKIKLRHHPGWKGWKEFTTDEAKASCLHCLHDFLTPFTSLPHGIMTSFRTPSDRLHGNGNHLEIPNRSTRKEKKIFRRVNNSLTQKLFWTKACFFLRQVGTVFSTQRSYAHLVFLFL